MGYMIESSSGLTDSAPPWRSHSSESSKGFTALKTG